MNIEFTVSGKIEDAEIDAVLNRLRFEMQTGLGDFPGQWQASIRRDGDKVKLEFACIIRSSHGWAYSDKPHAAIVKEFDISPGRAKSVDEVLSGIYESTRITVLQMVREALDAVPDEEIARYWRDVMMDRVNLKSSWRKD